MSIRKICGIYSITHIESGKTYVGQSQAIGDRWLWHRSALRRGKHPNRYLQSAWEKHGEQAFMFSVLEEVDIDEYSLCSAEQRWISSLRPAYNMAPVGGTTRGLKHPPRSAEFCRRMSEISKGRRHSQETIDLLKQRQSENPYRPTQAHIENLRSLMTGRKLSDQAIAKIRAANLGRPMHPNTRAALASANIGRKCSDSTKARIGEANRVRLTGNKQSAETIEKRRAALLGRKRPEIGDKLRGRKRPANVVSALREANDARYAVRRELIRTAILADPTASSSSIAKSIGVNRDTVRKYKQELLAA